MHTINTNKLAELIFALSSEEFRLLTSKMELVFQNANCEVYVRDLGRYLVALQKKYDVIVLTSYEDKEWVISSSFLITADILLIMEVLEEIRKERQKRDGSEV